VVRGRWNADTKAVFLDEYDDEGNVTTAKINGFVSFEKQTLVRFFGLHFRDGSIIHLLAIVRVAHRLGAPRALDALSIICIAAGSNRRRWRPVAIQVCAES
jgi:hypothetical protein